MVSAPVPRIYEIRMTATARIDAIPPAPEEQGDGIRSMPFCGVTYRTV